MHQQDLHRENVSDPAQSNAAVAVLPGPQLPLPTNVDESHHCLALDIVAVLLQRTTMDEVAQYLVLQALADTQPWQATIYDVGADSLLRVVGSFGLSGGRGDLHEHSCLDDPVIGDSLRGSILQTHASTVDGLPGMHAPDGPQVIWPLLTPSRLSGILQIRYHEEPDMGELSQRLAVMGPPIALALDLASAKGGRRYPTGIAAGSTAMLSAPAHARQRNDGELTPRQLEVLRHMSTGMTNGQIARVLKFSESTVRQETMAIYRTLQVRGRAEAVQFAEDHGLLDRPMPIRV